MTKKGFGYLFLDRLNSYDMSSEWLSTYRIGFALYGLFIFGAHNYSWLADIPDLLFSPPLSLAAPFDEFPPYPLLVLLSLAIVSCFVLLLLGFHTIWASLAITVLLLIGNSFKYSIGKIDHDILYVLCPAIMAFSGWGNRYSIDHKNGRSVSGTFPSVFIMALLLTFVMMTSAATKIWTGWFDPDIWAVKGHLLRSINVLEREGLFASQLVSIDSSFFWKSADYLVVAIEGFLPITFVFPRLFRWNIVGLLLFHLLVALSLGIPFLAYFAVYVLYFDWKVIRQNAFSRKIVHWVRRLPHVWLPWIMIICYVQWFSGEFWLEQPGIMRPTYLRLLIAQLNINIDAEIVLAIFVYGATFFGLLSIYFVQVLKTKFYTKDDSSNVHQ